MRDGSRQSERMRLTVSLLLMTVALFSSSGCGTGHTISAAEEASVTEGVSAAEKSYLVGDQKSAEGYNLHAHQAYSRAMNGALPYAQEGRAAEQVLVGKLYFGGKGVTQNYAEAAKWFQKAADQGDPEAKSLLAKTQELQNPQEGRAAEQVLAGKRYFGGKGVTQNYAEAAKWFQKAADQGDLEAKSLLAKTQELQKIEEALKEREHLINALLAQAEVAENRGDTNAATALYERLKKLRAEPEAKARNTHDRVGSEVYAAKKRDIDKKLEALQQDKKQEKRKTDYMLAQAAEERGDYDAALLLLEQQLEQLRAESAENFNDKGGFSEQQRLRGELFSAMKADYERVQGKQRYKNSKAQFESFLKAHYDPKDVVAQVLNYSEFGTEVISEMNSGFWYATSKCVYEKAGYRGGTFSDLRNLSSIDLNTVDPRTVRIEIAFNSYYFGGGAYYTIHVGDNFQLGDGRAHDRGRLERGWSMIFSQYCKGTKKAF